MLDDELVVVAPAERFLAHLSAIERSPNTVRAYAHSPLQLTRPSRRQHVAHANTRVSGLSSQPLQITVNGLYEAELIYGPEQGPWRSIEAVELATLSWVAWYSEQRLHGYLGNLPPAEFEDAHHARNTDQVLVGNQ